MGQALTRLERHVQETDDVGPSTGYTGWATVDGSEYGDTRYCRHSPTDQQIDYITKTLDIDLSATQQNIIHQHLRLILVAGGERAGKSFVSGLFGTTRTMFGEIFWIVGPDYVLARPEFDYWTESLLRLGAIQDKTYISTPRVGPWRAETKTGQVIETKTADDVRKLAAVAPDGIIMAEAAQHDFDSYLKCVGRLAQKRGWLLMSGTFEGSQGWYAERFEEWLDPQNVDGGVAFSLPTWENYHIYPGGREDPEILRLEQIYERVPGLFEERIAASPVPPHNLVFREFKHSIHVNPRTDYIPGHPVYLAVDPSAGTRPYAVVACQFVPHVRQVPVPDSIDYCNAFDEIYESGMIAEEIIQMAQKRPWWRDVVGGAIDPEAPDDRKRWLKYGKINLAQKVVKQLPGIRRLKTFLYYTRDPKTGKMIEPPHLQINPRARSLPYEFSRYKRMIPTSEDREPKDNPEANQPNHSLKALWYLLIARYGEVKGLPSNKPLYNWKRKK